MTQQLVIPNIDYLTKYAEKLSKLYAKNYDPRIKRQSYLFEYKPRVKKCVKERDEVIRLASKHTKESINNIVDQIANYYQLNSKYKLRFPNVEITDANICSERSIYDMMDGIYFFPIIHFILQ